MKIAHMLAAMGIIILATLTPDVHGEMRYIAACLDAKHVYNTIKEKCIAPEAVKRMSNILKAHKVDPEKDYITYKECMCRGIYSYCESPYICGPACNAAQCCGVSKFPSGGGRWKRGSSRWNRYIKCYEKCSLYKEALFWKANVHTCFPITTTAMVTKRGTCEGLGITATSFCPDGWTFNMGSAKQECVGAVCDNRLFADVQTCCSLSSPGYVQAFGCPRKKYVVDSHSTQHIFSPRIQNHRPIPLLCA